MSDFSGPVWTDAHSLDPVSVLPAALVDSSVLQLELPVPVLNSVVKLPDIFALSVPRLQNPIAMHQRVKPFSVVLLGIPVVDSLTVEIVVLEVSFVLTSIAPFVDSVSMLLAILVSPFEL